MGGGADRQTNTQTYTSIPFFGLAWGGGHEDDMRELWPGEAGLLVEIGAGQRDKGREQQLVWGMWPEFLVSGKQKFGSNFVLKKKGTNLHILFLGFSAFLSYNYFQTKLKTKKIL